MFLNTRTDEVESENKTTAQVIAAIILLGGIAGLLKNVFVHFQSGAVTLREQYQMLEKLKTKNPKGIYSVYARNVDKPIPIEEFTLFSKNKQLRYAFAAKQSRLMYDVKYGKKAPGVFDFNLPFLPSFQDILLAFGTPLQQGFLAVFMGVFRVILLVFFKLAWPLAVLFIIIRFIFYLSVNLASQVDKVFRAYVGDTVANMVATALRTAFVEPIYLFVPDWFLKVLGLETKQERNDRVKEEEEEKTRLASLKAKEEEEKRKREEAERLAREKEKYYKPTRFYRWFLFGASALMIFLTLTAKLPSLRDQSYVFMAISVLCIMGFAIFGPDSQQQLKAAYLLWLLIFCCSMYSSVMQTKQEFFSLGTFGFVFWSGLLLGAQYYYTIRETALTPKSDSKVWSPKPYQIAYVIPGIVTLFLVANQLMHTLVILNDFVPFIMLAALMFLVTHSNSYDSSMTFQNNVMYFLSVVFLILFIYTFVGRRKVSDLLKSQVPPLDLNQKVVSYTVLAGVLILAYMILESAYLSEVEKQKKTSWWSGLFGVNFPFFEATNAKSTKKKKPSKDEEDDEEKEDSKNSIGGNPFIFFNGMF